MSHLTNTLHKHWGLTGEKINSLALQEEDYIFMNNCYHGNATSHFNGESAEQSKDCTMTYFVRCSYAFAKNTAFGKQAKLKKKWLENRNIPPAK